MTRHYLDHNATCPVRPEVIDEDRARNGVAWQCILRTR